jgi:hypothetical protein
MQPMQKQCAQADPTRGTVTIRCECGGSRSIFPRKVEMCASQARPLPT